MIAVTASRPSVSAGLQNDVGFHLMQGAAAHGWDAVKSFAEAKTLRTEAFSAP